MDKHPDNHPDRHEIENRDQKLVQKFRQVVDGKALQRKKRFRARLLAGLLAACCAGFILFLAFGPSGQKPAAVIPPPDILKTDTLKPDALKTDKTGEVALSPPTQINRDKLLPSAKPAEAAKVPEIKKPPLPKTPLASDASKELPPLNDLNPDKAQISLPRTISPNEKILAKPKIIKPVVRNIRVAEIRTCREVSDMRYVSPQTVFSLGKNAVPHVW